MPVDPDAPGPALLASVRATELLEQAEALAEKATDALLGVVLSRFDNETGNWECATFRTDRLEEVEECVALVPALAARLRDALTVVEAARELRARSEYEPLDIDISDYSDEYGIAFLAGQTNALDAVLDGWPRRGRGGEDVTDHRCLGFGEREGRCENVAGTPWTLFWCPECDEERRASITASMERIFASFAAPAEEPPRG